MSPHPGISQHSNRSACTTVDLCLYLLLLYVHRQQWIMRRKSATSHGAMQLSDTSAVTVEYESPSSNVSLHHLMCPHYSWAMLASEYLYICTNSHETGDDSLQPHLQPCSPPRLELSQWHLSLHPDICQHSNRPAHSTVELCLYLLLLISAQTAMKLEMTVCSLSWSHPALWDLCCHCGLWVSIQDLVNTTIVLPLLLVQLTYAWICSWLHLHNQPWSWRW